MAGKISELAALDSPALTDEIEVLDVSDTTMAASGTNKRVLLRRLPSPVLANIGTTDTVIDPTIHPHLCTFLADSIYGNKTFIDLPSPANSPPAGTRYFIVAEDSSSSDSPCVAVRNSANTQTAEAADFTYDHIFAELIYLGSDKWVLMIFASYGIVYSQLNNS